MALTIGNQVFLCVCWNNSQTGTIWLCAERFFCQQFPITVWLCRHRDEVGFKFYDWQTKIWLL